MQVYEKDDGSYERFQESAPYYMKAAVASMVVVGYAGKKKNLGKLFKYGTVLGVSVVSPCYGMDIFSGGRYEKPVEHVEKSPICALVYALVLLGAYKVGERLAGK